MGTVINRAHSSRRISISILLLGAVILMAAGVVFLVTPPSISQPLAFSHQIHVEESGLECTDCHLYALSGVRATIPNTPVCADCHSEPSSESETELRLLEYVEAEELIPWQKVYWVPDHVFFSHRRHAGVAAIECETCHGSMADRVEPVSHRNVPITMGLCIECHEEMGASNDCILCHR